MTETASTELANLPDKEGVKELFAKPKGIEQAIELIEKEVRAEVQDYSTDKGRKAARALAAKVSRSKTLIDSVGKDLNEERNRLNKEVNAVRNLSKDRLDALRDELRKPADEFEEKEAARVKAHMLELDKFNPGELTSQNTTAEIQAKIDLIEAVEVNSSWEEFEEDAREQKALALDKFAADLTIAKAREDQDAELEQLRREKEEREAKDREERAAREAAERAAKQKADREQAEKAAAERAAKDAEEKAARDKQEAEERHRQELEASKARELEAAAAERKRIADEQAEKERQEAERRAQEETRLKIRTEIVQAITALAPKNYEHIVDAMIDGKIPHVEVRF